MKVYLQKPMDQWNDSDKAAYLADCIEEHGIKGATQDSYEWEAQIYIDALRTYSKLDAIISDILKQPD